MRFNIKRAVRNLKRVTILSVLQEAIVNAIDAGATQIDVVIEYMDTGITKFIHGLSVKDNGSGFTKENIDSFCEYGSEYKLKLGGKGSGRIAYLKFFNDVEIKSFIKKEGKTILIDFNQDFKGMSNVTPKSGDKISADGESAESNQTIVHFKNALDDKGKFPAEIEEVKDEIYTHLLPLLYLNKKQNITISFQEKGEGEPIIIEAKTLPNFKTSEFKICDTKGEEVAFTLHYHLSNESGKNKLQGYYCAGKRTVQQFKEKELPIQPIENHHIILLLTSEFFDKNVNDERNDFHISPMQAERNLFGDLSWEMINCEARREIEKILYGQFPNLRHENQKRIEAIKNDYLHLAEYLDIPLGGLSDKEAIIKEAESKFSKDKQDFRKSLPALGNATFKDDTEIIKKASDLAGKELIEYVLMRNNIIKELEKQIDSSGRDSESILHNLIMPQWGDSDPESKKFISPTENHIWLVDDKFMSYSYAASDRTIAHVLEKGVGTEGVTGKNAQGRPDISIFFQKEKDNANAVIIELKALEADAAQKHAGLLELRNYATKFKEAQKLNNVWYYLITKIDDDFKTALKGDNFKLLFSTDEKIYFNYYDTLSLYLYVMSIESLLLDAKARNKTFIDIIKKNTTIKE